MTLSLEEIAEKILAAVNHPDGAFGLMVDYERAMGRTIVPVGSTRPFAVPAADWLDALIAIRGMDALIVVVRAVQPGTGALSRLVASIRRAHLTPVIVAPMGDDMPMILRHWGWVKTNAADEWRPGASSANP